jgi:hypothetical protein
LIVKSFGNVHCPVKNHFKPQSASGIDPGNCYY